MLSFNTCIAPSVGKIKVNVHAAVMDGEWIGLGCVLGDERGKIICVVARRLMVSWDTGIAKFAAARFWIYSAHQHKFNKVVIESDALNMIVALQPNKLIWTPIFHFLEGIRALMPSFSSLLSSHVKSVGNVLHTIALVFDTIVYSDNFPRGICTLAEMKYKE